tara:strand:+ start:460 stop:714 length:255 start_codon:yes stop_codon:yes gene_type:complete
MENIKNAHLSEDSMNFVKAYKESREHLLDCIDQCFEAHYNNAKALQKKVENKDYYTGIIVAFNDARRIIRMYSEELEDIEMREM